MALPLNLRHAVDASTFLHFMRYRVVLGAFTQKRQLAGNLLCGGDGKGAVNDGKLQKLTFSVLLFVAAMTQVCSNKSFYIFVSKSAH